MLTAEDGDTRLLDEILPAISRTSQGSSWVRRHISSLIDAIFSSFESDESDESEASVRIAMRALPYVEDAWFHDEDKYAFVDLWTTAASFLEYTPEIGQSVVEVLLRMACAYQWRPNITWAAWVWLKKRPQLPPVCRARSLCCNDLGAISKVESLKDTKILRDYLIVVWSEWDWLAPWVCSYMCAVIRKYFGGERKKGHRNKLRDRLVHIKKQLDLGLDHLRNQGSEMPAAYLQPTKEAYEALLETLSEVESLRISRESSPDREDTPSDREFTHPDHEFTHPDHEFIHPDHENTLSYSESTPRSRRSAPRSRRSAPRSRRSAPRSPERIPRSLESADEDTDSRVPRMVSDSYHEF